MLTLYITRHGETEWNIQKRIQGHKDSPLTEKGRKQAQALGNYLKNIPFEKVFVSDSNRAYETACTIMEGRDVPIIKEVRLREMNIGIWEGSTFEEVERLDPIESYHFWHEPHLYQPQGGESFFNTRDRAYSFIQELIEQHQEGNILLVTHTITLKHIMSLWDEREVAELWNEPFVSQTSLSIVELEEGQGTIKVYAETPHLE